jgi:large subunit ribosomal protein L21
MLAHIRSGGKQFKVTEGMNLKIPSIPSKVGDEVTFDEVLLLSDGEKRYLGTPTIKGAHVKAEVVSHGRDDKQVIFKYKRRKSYHLKKGHRQGYTEVKIKSIVVPGKTKSKKAVEEKEKQAKSKEIKDVATEKQVSKAD